MKHSSSAVTLATAGYDHTIRFWDAASGYCLSTIQHPESQVNRLEISPDKGFIAAAGNPHVKFYEIGTANGQAIMSYDGHTSNVTALGFQREGRWLYSAGEDSTIKFWDLRAPGCQREYKSPSPITCAMLHPNQGELITGDQMGNVRVWDLTANVCSREVVPEGENAIRSVSIASDGGYCVAANNKGNVYIWKLGDEDTSRFDPMQKLEAHKAYITRVLLSPDSKLLATCSADKTIKIWKQDINNSSHPAHPAGSTVRGLPPAQPKGSSLRNVTSPFDFKLLKTLQGHQRWVWDCCFSADSAYLLSASSDNHCRLWDLNLGDSIQQYVGHQKAVSCVALAD